MPRRALALSLGGSLPLHAGGAARALLAFEPKTFWDDYLEHWTPERLTERTSATREALLEELPPTPPRTGPCRAFNKRSSR